MRPRTIALPAGLAALISLGLAPSALGFGLSSPNAQPTNLAAGANSDLSIRIDVQQPSEQLRDLTIHLPPGLVGNPLATPLCTEDQLNADACAAASDVGDVSNDVLVAGMAQTVHGNLYNVVPRAGEPARFGIVLVPPIGSKIILQSPARLRQSDFGLDSVLTDLPREAQIAPGIKVPIQITSTTLTIAGQVGSPPKGFLRNPTSCTPKHLRRQGIQRRDRRRPGALVRPDQLRGAAVHPRARGERQAAGHRRAGRPDDDDLADDRRGGPRAGAGHPAQRHHGQQRAARNEVPARQLRGRHLPVEHHGRHGDGDLAAPGPGADRGRFT